MTESLSPRRLRQLRALVAFCWLFATIAILGSLTLWFMRGLPPLPLSFLHGPGSNLAIGLLGFTYGTVGATLAARRPTNFIGWLFVVTGVLLGLVLPLNLLVMDSVHTFRPVPPLTLFLAWAISSFDAPLAAGTAFIVAVLFPGDQSPSRWRWLVAVQLIAFLLIGVGSALNPGGLIWFPTLPNPLSLPESLDPAFHGLLIVALGLAILGMVAGALSLAIRYRAADPHLRLQLRWIMAAIALLPFTTAPLFLARYWLGASNEVGEWLMIVAGIGGSAFPVAVAIAIMRHHLFGIDRLVERALVFVPLTAILAGLYAASVALFQRLFMAVTGTTSDASVIISTLILASTFTPIRQALERVVDRRFNPKHAATAAMAHARVVGEPSMLPAAAVIVELPAGPSPRVDEISAWREDARVQRSPIEGHPGGVDRIAAEGGREGVAGTRLTVTDPVEEAVVAALDRLGDRLAAIEDRIARLEDERDGDELFGRPPVVIPASTDPGHGERAAPVDHAEAADGIGQPAAVDHAAAPPPSPTPQAARVAS